MVRGKGVLVIVWLQRLNPTMGLSWSHTINIPIIINNKSNIGIDV